MGGGGDFPSEDRYIRNGVDIENIPVILFELIDLLLIPVGEYKGFFFLVECTKGRRRAARWRKLPTEVLPLLSLVGREEFSNGPSNLFDLFISTFS